MAEKRVFSKAPLKEVIFEIIFSTNMSVACRRDEFYNEIRKDYPIVILPKPPSLEEHPFAQPSQYLNKDNTKKITCSSESFSFSTIKYESFKVFGNETIRLIKIFLGKYRTIDKITRIGFRYTNHIPVERKGNKIDLSRYLNFKFSLPNSLDKRLLELFQTAFYIGLEEKTSGIRLLINSIKDKDGKDILILDFDLISLKEIDIKEIEKYLVDYHNKIEEFFLDIITENYKKSIE